MILLSHPTGNAFVRNAALALSDADLLSEYWTCLRWRRNAGFAKWLPRRFRRQLDRRALPEWLMSKAHYLPWREAGRMVFGRLGPAALTRHETGPFSVDAVYRSLDAAVARRVERGAPLRAVYAYEDGAAATFSAARRKGVHCIYDLPIGYWRAAHAIYHDEREREPEWAATLTGIFDSPEKLDRKDHELKLAQTVLVASTFTRDTLKLSGTDVDQVQIIPYGAPPVCQEGVPRDTQGKVKVLFVGGLGQRKGLSYLLAAADLMRAGIELTLIGMKACETCEPLNAALRCHRWIPTLPHGEILREMSRHDVFVFPSLFEGFGLVILEAMSQGLPVITTANTAGPDIITDGEDGFIVPIRSAEAIAGTLDRLAADRVRLRSMREAAKVTAARLTWDAYRVRVAQTVATEINQMTPCK